MAKVAHELRRVRQGQIIHQQRTVMDVVALRIRMGRAIQRESLVQKHARPCHNPRTVANNPAGEVTHELGPGKHAALPREALARALADGLVPPVRSGRCHLSRVAQDERISAMNASERSIERFMRSTSWSMSASRLAKVPRSEPIACALRLCLR